MNTQRGNALMKKVQACWSVTRIGIGMREAQWSTIPTGGSRNTGAKPLMLSLFPEKHFSAGNPWRFYQSQKHQSKEYRIPGALSFSRIRINFTVPPFVAIWTFPKWEFALSQRTGTV